MYGQLLAQLSALSKLYQFAHWKVKGQLSYQDHLLFERLYDEVDELIDGVAEKAVGIFGPQEIDSVENAKQIMELLTSWKGLRAEHSLPNVALKAVRDVIEFITTTKAELEKGDKLTDGMDNQLQGLADQLESHVYLLQQRTADKIASVKYAAGVYGWWISPTGIPHEVEFQGHAKFVKTHPEIFGEEVASGELDFHEYYKIAFGLGWIRAHNDQDTIDFQLPDPTKDKIQVIKKALWSMPVKQNVAINQRGGDYAYAKVPTSYFKEQVKTFKDMQDMHDMLQSSRKYAGRTSMKTAATQGEYEIVDDKILNILKIYETFKVLSRGKDLEAADHFAELLEPRIMDCTSELRALIREDLEGKTSLPEVAEKALEEAGLKLQLLGKKLKEVREFMAMRRQEPKSEKTPTKRPMMIVKKPVKAELVKMIAKLASEFDAKGLVAEADALDKELRELTKHPADVEEYKGYDEDGPSEEGFGKVTPETVLVGLKHRLLKQYGSKYAPVLSERVLNYIAGMGWSFESGQQDLSEFLENLYWTPIFQRRLKDGDCVSCGREIDPTYAIKGKMPPICVDCLNAPVNPLADEFLTERGLDKIIQRFYEQPTDPNLLGEDPKHTPHSRVDWDGDEYDDSQRKSVVVPPEDVYEEEIVEKHLAHTKIINTLKKLAYHLDQKGLYSEADKIDAMIEQLAQRVGLVAEATKKAGISKRAVGPEWMQNVVPEQPATPAPYIGSPLKPVDLSGVQFPPELKRQIENAVSGDTIDFSNMKLPQETIAAIEKAVNRKPGVKVKFGPVQFDEVSVKDPAKKRRGLSTEEVKQFKDTFIKWQVSKGYAQRDVERMYPRSSKWSKFNAIWAQTFPNEKTLDGKVRAMNAEIEAKRGAQNTNQQSTAPGISSVPGTTVPTPPVGPEEAARQSTAQFANAANPEIRSKLIGDIIRRMGGGLRQDEFVQNKKLMTFVEYGIDKATKALQNSTPKTQQEYTNAAFAVALKTVLPFLQREKLI